MLSETSESLFLKVKDAAGIHFSTFQDPKEKGKSEDVIDDDEEAIERGAQVVRSNHRPDAAWKAKHFAPVEPDTDRGIKVLEYR